MQSGQGETSSRQRFAAGTRIRRVANPSDLGCCTGAVEGHEGDLEIEVSFGNRRPEWVMEGEIELLDSGPRDPVDLLLAGQASRFRDLRRELVRTQLSGRLSEMFYSMDTTGTQFMPHQFKPVLAMLDSPSKGLLIADEVGLGKTIEAGLIWTELRFRKQARTLLVVCPAMLTEKWKLELQNRFGTSGLVTDARGLLEHLKRPPNAHQDLQCFICSLQGLRPGKDWEDEVEDRSAASRLARKLRDCELNGERPFDLTIIDEAHYLRNAETASARLGALLRPVSDYFVLLSATPINNRSSDLFSLLSLVDPEHFQFESEFSTVLEANRPLVKAVALLRSQSVPVVTVIEALMEAQASPVLSAMEQLAHLIDDMEGADVASSMTLADRIALIKRIEGINLLGHAITRTRKREVLERNVIREPVHYRVPMSDAERDFYDRVTQAVRVYANRFWSVEGFLLATPQRQMASSLYAAARRWLAGGKSLVDAEFRSEALDAEDLELEIAPLVSHLATSLVGFDPEPLRESDSKFDKLVQVLRDYFLHSPTEKIIVFSYFRDTLAYLHERLSEVGISSVVVQGGDQKVEIIEHFRTSDSLRVLLSSEVAAEGVDLQFMGVLVNYDLPWNPMKVEQRIGRIDRIGQKQAKIHILNLVYEETIDDRIVLRLFEKLDIFRSALGDADDVVGEEISRLTRELFSGALSKDEEEQQYQQTLSALEQRKSDLRVVVESESDLVGLGDYIRAEVLNARGAGKKISDDDLFRYVEDFLYDQVPGHVFQSDARDGRRVRLQLSLEVAIDFERFIGDRRLRRSQLASGHPCELRIENHVATTHRPGEELINQFHPLIPFIGQKCRDAVRPVPAVAVKASSAMLDRRIEPGVYGFAAQLWTFEGAGEDQLLRAAIVPLAGNPLVDAASASEVLLMLRAHDGDWLEYRSVLDDKGAIEDILAQAKQLLTSAYARERRQRRAENDDRERLQREAIERNFKRRIGRLDERLRQAEVGSRRVLAANRTRIAQERARLTHEAEMSRARLQSRSQFKASRTDIALGLLKVEP